jgi:hypothetical protein
VVFGLLSGDNCFSYINMLPIKRNTKI